MTVSANAVPQRHHLMTRRERFVMSGLRRGVTLHERALVRLLGPIEPQDPARFDDVVTNADQPSHGDVLGIRSVKVRVLRRVLAADSWQVKFRSTDSHDVAIDGIATVIVPRRPFDGPVRPLLSYQPAIDSLGPAADPSYTLQRGNQYELPLMSLALRRGWAVVVTDYTGPNHAFGVGLLGGRLVLDGVRAALGCEQAGLDAAAPVGLWGYSGGAQATLFAAEQQPAYAPDLNLAGVAAGGITGDPGTAPEIFENGSVLSGVWFGAMVGSSRDLGVDLAGSFTPEGRDLVEFAADMTFEQLIASFPYLRWGDYLTVPSVLHIPRMRAAIEANRFCKTTPTAPMFLYHSMHDQNRAIADVDKMVDAYRDGGAEIRCQRFRFGEHMIAMLIGVPGALRFLTESFVRASTEAS